MNLKKGIPFPLIEWAWSPELDIKIPYRRKKGRSKFCFVFFLGWGGWGVGEMNLRPTTTPTYPLSTLSQRTKNIF